MNTPIEFKGQLQQPYNYSLAQITSDNTCPAEYSGDDSEYSWMVGNHYGVGIYLGLTMFSVLIRFARSFIYRLTTTRSSRNLHDQMYTAVIRSPVRFYDSNPKGRILNRFSGDTGAIDGQVPQTIMDFLSVSLELLDCSSKILKF